MICRSKIGAPMSTDFEEAEANCNKLYFVSCMYHARWAELSQNHKVFLWTLDSMSSHCSEDSITAHTTADCAKYPRHIFSCLSHKLVTWESCSGVDLLTRRLHYLPIASFLHSPPPDFAEVSDATSREPISKTVTSSGPYVASSSLINSRYSPCFWAFSSVRLGLQIWTLLFCQNPVVGVLYERHTLRNYLFD